MFVVQDDNASIKKYYKQLFFIVLNMSNFVPKKESLREILLHYLTLKKSAAEAHGILFETYGQHALSEITCRDWFRCFKNNDFDFEDKERSGAPRKFEDKELEALLTHVRC